LENLIKEVKFLLNDNEPHDTKTETEKLRLVISNLKHFVNLFDEDCLELYGSLVKHFKLLQDKQEQH